MPVMLDIDGQRGPSAPPELGGEVAGTRVNLEDSALVAALRACNGGAKLRPERARHCPPPAPHRREPSRGPPHAVVRWSARVRGPAGPWVRAFAVAQGWAARAPGGGGQLAAVTNAKPCIAPCRLSV